MGWASGARLAEEVWELFRPYLAPEDRRELARALIVLFRAEDCDTIDEAEELTRDAGEG